LSQSLMELNSLLEKVCLLSHKYVLCYAECIFWRKLNVMSPCVGYFCPALAKAVKTMKKGEKVLLTVKPQCKLNPFLDPLFNYMVWWFTNRLFLFCRWVWREWQDSSRWWRCCSSEC
jgi:hypothetical protein